MKTPAMPRPDLKVALIGYGLAGKVFHAPLIRATPGLQLSTVVSSRTAEIAADLPGVAVAADLAHALADQDIALVVVATPDETHYDLAAQAIAAGRHVVVDKPFTITLAEAESLVDQARTAGVMLSVFHNRRWTTEFLTAQHLIATGAIGEIVAYEARFDRHRPVPRDRWRERKGRGAGVWHDLGPHLVDQALQLLGEPVAVWADIASQRTPDGAPDYFHAVLRYPTLNAVLHAGVRAIAPGPILAVHGARASYVKHGLDPQEDQAKQGLTPGSTGWGVDPCPGRLTTLTDDGGAIQGPAPSLAGDYPRYYARLRDALRGEGDNPVTPAQAVAVMKVLAMGIRSSAERREIAWS